MHAGRSDPLQHWMISDSSDNSSQQWINRWKRTSHRDWMTRFPEISLNNVHTLTRLQTIVNQILKSEIFHPQD